MFSFLLYCGIHPNPHEVTLVGTISLQEKNKTEAEQRQTGSYTIHQSSEKQPFFAHGVQVEPKQKVENPLSAEGTV